jgi:hypothetical protein
MIKRAIRLNNDLVMVFDENGEQLSEYQGKYDDVKQRIFANASPDTVYVHWFGDASEPKIVPVQHW